MAHDTVIVGGTVIDGSGAPGRRADVAIDADRITAVGSVDRQGARRVVDATNRLVTPGFVDIHSHLDAQVGWDPLMTSSCWHGVTSVVMGNCGMTFAPVRPGQAELLAQTMESVEDIPATSILAGLPWDWESFGGYLDAVARRPRALNVGGYVGDVAIRLYVCGLDACDPEFAASEGQLAEMAGHVDAALDSGALGYSISRSLFHRVPDGRHVPGTWSDPREFFAAAEPLHRRAQGALECAPRYNVLETGESRVDEELAWMAELSRTTGRPFSFNLQQIVSLGDHYRRVIELTAAANEAGARLRPQITPRSVGVLFSLAASTLIDDLPSFRSIAHLDLNGRLAAIRDARVRAALIEEGVTKPEAMFEQLFLMEPDRPVRYDHPVDDSIATRARRAGVSCVEAYLHALDASDGRAIVDWPVMNQDESAIEELLTSPHTMLGLADGGAHATQIMDASQPTYLLAHWARDRGVISLEEAVRKLTSEPASFIGFAGRGTLSPGAFADVNVIDLDGLALDLPEIVHDFPGGAARFIQRARGFDATIVNGDLVLDRGRHTGALPGHILRGHAPA